MGGHYVAIHCTCQTQILISKCFASHTEKKGRNSCEKKMKKMSLKIQINNAANYIERFNIPTVMMAMFTMCVTFVDYRYIKLCLWCNFKFEIVKLLDSNHLKSFPIYVIIWILKLFYLTTSSLKTHFFINRILYPITGDVTSILYRYSSDNTHQIQKKMNCNKTRESWKLANGRVVLKMSPYTLSQCIQIFTWAMTY